MRITGDRRTAETLSIPRLSRRAFVVGSLASGFALAVMPVSAQTITTDTNGLVAGEVKIPAPGGQIPAYRAMPASGGPFPTMLVVHEIFGVHEHIKDICRRLAKVGYFAVAPALYAREGDVSAMTEMKGVMKVVSRVPDSQVAADLDATVKWAAGTGKADTAKLGIVGFCWGGRQVWLYAAHNPNLKAGVAWYGVLHWTKNPLTPKDPVDLVPQMNAPVLGLYGGADDHIPAAQVDELRLSLKAAGKPSEIIIYPGTPHGFNADYRPSYRPRQAKDAWQRMLAWLKDHGVA
ncbi:MAG TPA: dienelactone hydrolase family protein [Candidatus Binataceae bacterium]|nr:dienelactone hydrolase family protein [Candidatus Binataceae bacterium]